jgi:methionine-rich copper-binding protein CopC
MIRHRLVRAGFGLACTLATVVMTASPAAAHAKVLRTTPGNGATVTGTLSLIRIDFDDPVQLVPRSLVVSGATGAPEPIGAPRVVGGRTLEASLPGHLPQGRYFVGWRILSDDGHVESGSFTFAVGAAGSAASTAADVGSQLPAPGQPTWPVVLAAVMAGLAVLGAGLVVTRGLAAVRSAAVGHYPPEKFDRASAREHAPMRR